MYVSLSSNVRVDAFISISTVDSVHQLKVCWRGMPPALTALVLVASLAAACLGGVQAGVMAVGKLQTCVNDGSVSASERIWPVVLVIPSGGGRRAA